MPKYNKKKNLKILTINGYRYGIIIIIGIMYLGTQIGEATQDKFDRSCITLLPTPPRWFSCDDNIFVRCNVVLISFNAACISGEDCCGINDGLRCGAGAGGGGVNCTVSNNKINGLMI